MVKTFGIVHSAGNPFFPRFCPLFDGPSPPFEGNSRKISQNGAPAKSYSTKNTVHTIPNIPTGKCRKLTDTGQTASKQMGYNSRIEGQNRIFFTLVNIRQFVRCVGKQILARRVFVLRRKYCTIPT